MNAEHTKQLALNGGTPVRKEPFPPWPDYGEEEISAAVEVMRSGKLARQSGSRVRQFEEAFADKFGVRYAIATSSGTAAIHIALSGLGIGPGDDVINTAHCFIGTATPVLHAGAVPIFADIDPRTYNIDPNSVAEKITPHTRAIVPVHLNGCPADMGPLLEIARHHNLHIVEDSAQAHGAEYQGRLAGTIGDVGCFSFWEDKLMTTLGEGGMVITNDEEVAKRARMVHHHGELREDGDYYKGERLYVHPFLGYNFRMTEVQGAVGLVQLARLDEYIEARRKNAHHLTRLLNEIPGIIPPYEPDGVKHVFYKYILRLDRQYTDVTAKDFVEALSAEGVRCSRRYPTPLHRQPVFTEKRGFGLTNAPFVPPWYAGDPQYGTSLPNADKLPEDLVTIRMAPNLNTKDIQDIAEAVEKVMEAYRRA